MNPDDPDYNPDREREVPEQYDAWWTPDEDDPQYREYLIRLAQKKEEDNG